MGRTVRGGGVGGQRRWDGWEEDVCVGAEGERLFGGDGGGGSVGREEEGGGVKGVWGGSM